MAQLERFAEAIDTYRRFEWQLRRVLMTVPTRTAIGENELFQGAEVMDAEIDAAWFARPSHEGREAWELRLIGETPYALFETFEADEAEEDREDLRLEMEARLRDYVNRV